MGTKYFPIAKPFNGLTRVLAGTMDPNSTVDDSEGSCKDGVLVKNLPLINGHTLSPRRLHLSFCPGKTFWQKNSIFGLDQLPASLSGRCSSEVWQCDA